VKKVVVKILQSSVVTQTALAGLTIQPRVANFLKYIWCQKLCKLVGSRQSYCKNKQAYFFGPPCTITYDSMDENLQTTMTSSSLKMQVKKNAS